MAAFKALLCQVVAWCLLLLIAPRLASGPDWPHPLALALTQGLLAAGMAALIKSERWWLVIHSVFSPLLVLGLKLEISPSWFLAGFIVLGLTFWTTFRTRVPLYLSNRATAQALLTLLPESPVHMVDLGCGTGGLLRTLATARPDCRFTGIEAAPLPWLISRIACAGLANCTIHRGNLWHSDLSQADWVYCFLSPIPMPAIQMKARKEMRRGSWLVSNSFPLPGAPARTLTLDDARTTCLYLYRF